MHLSTRTLFSAAFVACSLFPLAVQAQQQLVPAQSEIQFVSRQMGVPVEGRFRSFDAKVAFDPAKPETSSIAFTVDTGSATLGVRETDAELPKPTWFNVAQFPQATFQSSAVRRVDATRFEVAGKLSIKGVSSDVVVPVTLAQNGAQTVATGAFPIKRLTFRIGDKEWSDTSMVADEVQVRFRLTLAGVSKL
ncbi:YceI family protein [Hydrogenophaga sp.]|uniref:YceI family protein n=1 Tax=Hydrogenophaga sp. TaxID=1904254 RepID=UPI00271592D2|nr:YceI family protein [Hydrogenophaga sp.]MDO8906289.1 YceI family protein [Hydrogenophaga sp.]